MERVIIEGRKMNPMRLSCNREEKMRPGLKTELLIDAKIESYKSFFDFEWAKKLSLLTDGTPLEEHVFIFILNWRATANAQFMPWLMMHSIEHVETEYLRPKPTMMEWAMRAVIDMVSNLMEGELSKTKRKAMSKQIRDFLTPKIEEGRKSALTFAHPEAKPENLFRMFMQNEGGVELVYAIFGAQRICYSNIFHEYENFVKRCVGLVKKAPDYRAPNWKTLHKDVEAEFGKPIADYCLKDQPVETGRLIRNCLAHGGGKLSTDDIAALPKGSYEEIDGFVRIMPKHNRALFDALKERAMKLAESTLPHLTK
jgi:hypothetical protein